MKCILPLVRFVITHGRERKGVCSIHFAERIKPGDIVPIYLKKIRTSNSDEARYTGYYDWTRYWNCSFRAYLQEREELGMTGKHGCSLVINTVVLTFYMKKK